MIACPACSKTISDEATSCPSCGVSLLDSFSPTRPLETPASGSEARKAGNQDETLRATDRARRSSARTTSLDSIDNARFVAGAILNDRYRIVGLLGKSGMGEIYCADDLKLSQPVALKFLLDHLLSDGGALGTFLI
jgi:hypothetical protein